MKFQLRILILPLIALFLCTGTAMAIPTIDGDMSDWGTQYYTDGEETFGDPNAYFVNPGWGGQDFDVEKIGLQFDGDNVYFGLQTGFDLLNGVMVGNDKYEAGDLFIDFGSDGSWDIAIGMDLILSTVIAYENPYFVGSTPYSLTDGTEIDSVEGYHGTGINAYNENVYSLEGMFNLTALGLGSFIGQDATIHWTMSCGNDILEHTAESVPEPATLFLLGTGLIGLVGIQRKVKK